MAITPNQMPGIRKSNPFNKWVNLWEKSIDAFLRGGKYRRDKKDFETICFTSTDVRRFVKKKLPRKNQLIDDQLEVRYKKAGWEGVLIVGERFYFRVEQKPDK